jgi:hypothetical protein
MIGIRTFIRPEVVFPLTPAFEVAELSGNGDNRQWTRQSIVFIRTTTRGSFKVSAKDKIEKIFPTILVSKSRDET